MLTQLARNWKQSLIQKYSKRSAAKKFDVTQSRVQEWVKQERNFTIKRKEQSKKTAKSKWSCKALFGSRRKEMAVFFQELDLSEEEEKDMNDSDVLSSVNVY
uniref:Uncharacterized protein n=1 Tax=Ditylenchus dipsaci TaxID=166011 RepID=A0A915EQJ1_9BILA